MLFFSRYPSQDWACPINFSMYSILSSKMVTKRFIVALLLNIGALRMLRYAHTISSASRRLASRHPMFCDPCTAGPRQFYPLRNNNLSNSKSISGSILDFAKTINPFVNVFTGADTTDLPNNNAKYCVAHIESRAGTWFVSIFGRDNRIYTNYYGESWIGWQSTALESDLADNLNHKKQILPWGNYGDGNHSISNFTFGSNLYISVGTSAKVQKRCSIISPNDTIEIPHKEGFITIVFNDANHITVSGTTGNYQLREIRASNLLGV